MGEFDLIERYFRSPAAALAVASPPDHAHISVGVGDDCAVLKPTPGFDWCVSTDLLVEGRHFLSTVSPEALGHKSLAVNLSDLAACGARPVGFTLSLALPRVDAAWLAGFSDGLLTLAAKHRCPLVGGDTTQGPLTIGITVFGEVPSGSALLRSGARGGDELWVSGTIGQARAALEVFRGTARLDSDTFQLCRERMERPTPRVALGQALRGIASACLDVSDGLVGDLRHLLRASGRIEPLVAQIDLTSINPFFIATNPIDSVTNGQNAIKKLSKPGFPTPEQAIDWVLNGGDDYELVFTAPARAHEAVLAAARACTTPVTCIGQVTPCSNTQTPATVWLRQPNGSLVAAPGASFDHFA